MYYNNNELNLHFDIFDNCKIKRLKNYSTRANARNIEITLGVEKTKRMKTANNSMTVNELIDMEIKQHLANNSKINLGEIFKLLLNDIEQNTNYKYGLYAVGLERCKNILNTIYKKGQQGNINNQFKKYENFCLLAQTNNQEPILLNGSIKFNYNTFALFFNIELINNSISFSLERISFFNYNNLLRSIEELQKINKIYFCCDLTNNCENSKNHFNPKTIERSNIDTLHIVKPIKEFNDYLDEDKINLTKIKKYIEDFWKVYSSKKPSVFILNLDKEEFEIKLGDNNDKVDFDLNKNNIFLLVEKDFNLPQTLNYRGYFSDVYSTYNNYGAFKADINFLTDKQSTPPHLLNEIEDKVNNEINKLNSEIDEINLKINEKEVNIKNNNSYIKDIDEKIFNKEKQEEIDKLEKENLEHLESIRKNNLEINSFRNNKSSKKILHLKVKIENANAALSQNKDQISYIKSKLFPIIVDQTKVFLTNQKSEIENQNKKINSELRQLQQNKTNISSQVSIKKNDLSIVQKLKEKLIETGASLYKISNFKVARYSKDFDYITIDSYFDNHNSESYFNRYPISNLNQGEKAMIARFRRSMKYLFDGYYKQPLLIPSLYLPLEVDIQKVNDYDITDRVIKKYALNEKQKISFLRAVHSDSLFLLQGPPGTGKTQVICALIDYYQQKNKNVVLTSSTHEAIENAFDRFAKEYPDDPNIFAIKISSGNKRDREFYSKNLLAIRYKIALKSQKNLVSSELKINKFCENIKSLREKLRNKFNNLQQFIDISIPKLLDEVLKNKNIQIFSDNKFRYEYIADSKTIINIIESFEEVFYQYHNVIPFIDSYNELEKYIDNDNEYFEVKKRVFDRLDTLTIDYPSEIDNIVLSSNDEELIDNLFKHQLINLFGMTTTSSTEIEHKDTRIDILTDYKIETSIMDETSKANLFEIVNRCLFSKKIILAGDAYQLPPTSNFSPELYEKIKKNVDRNGDEIIYSEDEIKRAIDYPYFEEIIKNLSKIDKNAEKRAYVFLEEQHRFPEKITKFINALYEEKSQKLITGKQENKFEKFDLKYFGNEKLNMVSTTYMPKWYSRQLMKYNPDLNIDNHCFDSQYLIEDGVIINKEIINKFKDTRKASGNINQFSALVILQVLKSLLQNKEVKDLLKKATNYAHIGIICLTTNQAKLIKRLILNNLPQIYRDYVQKRKIVIDTIDNFQGRECEIILVDLIRSGSKLDIGANGKLKIINSNRNIDFLNDEKRLNVAFSRTKNILIIFGNFEDYQKPSYWKDQPKHIKKYMERVGGMWINASDILEDKNETR